MVRESFADRLREVRNSMRLDQLSFAELGGVKKNSQINYEAGRTAPSVDYLYKLRDHGIDIEYLLSGHRVGEKPKDFLGEVMRKSGSLKDSTLGYRGAEPEPGSDLVSVAMLDFGYGMGGTYLDDALQQATTEQFPRAFLRNYTKAPADQLYFAKGIGDSMMPTIHDSDLVLIDRSQDTARMNDQVWAVARGEIGMIKRLRFTGKDAERVVIMSDNADVSDDTAVDGELTIIGRVVAVVKRI